ncbi:hypothetical protein Q7P37_004225 [Cladosporium fusiforme]
MPTYKSLGVSASLSVTRLDTTLSDAIQLRMGASQKEDAARIKTQLDDGRKLPERPCAFHNQKVGTLDFVGEDGDMVFLSVKAGDLVGRDQSVPSEVYTKGESTPKTDLGTTPTSAHPSSPEAQVPVATQSSANDALALCLDVDCAKMIKRKDLGTLKGKDLKLELFLNGELVEVTYESTRSYIGKRNGLFRFSGTRFHRQSEKPFIYVPTSDTSGVSNIGDQRWVNINKSLQQEAIDRDTDQSTQRAPSASFLGALAQQQLSECITSDNYAVFDLVITAGRGKKFGPSTPYVTQPTRLENIAFKGTAPAIGNSVLEDHVPEEPTREGSASKDPVSDDPISENIFSEDLVSEDLGPYRLQNGIITSEYEDPDILNFQSSYQETSLGSFAGNEPEVPNDPPRQNTPEPEYNRRSQTYIDVLETIPMRKEIQAYENAHGKPKGRRTLRQRLGDMIKMSPRKREEVLTGLRGEIDDDIIQAMRKALGMDDPVTPTPAQRQVIFNMDNLGSREGMGRESAPQTSGVTFEPLDPLMMDAEEDATGNTEPVKTPLDALAPLSSKSTPPKRPGANRVRDRWDPSEKTVSEALESFEIPASCVGSAVTYAEGKTQRQIAKARGGQFHEVEFVLGIRFVVL